MANIGATTAFYKVETSLTRANSEVSKSMERLATGKANANAGDRSSYVAMADTFRLDFVGTKAGIKGASVVMGYLETGMRVLDSASGLLSRLQELAVLGANDTNTEADAEAIDREAEAIADEFHRLMSTSTYKGKDVFVASASGEYVSMGGRDAEMTFGIGEVEYQEMYIHGADDYSDWETETGLDAAAGGDLETTVIMKGSSYDALVAATQASENAFNGEADITNIDAIGDDFIGAVSTVTTDVDAAATLTVRKTINQLRYSASEGMYTLSGGNPQTNLLTTVVQKRSS